ncbi:MAG TPA: Asp-tRNA(Asn)/Glu-tRNA(Gln) amidotransferase subunit GatB [Candidatus Paceibacterota bacterium]|nr:Asp-tRNA(Asn)/Glu-tRNA(Gln) amidotransferase subunit GatB [Candidatus Paceibacterota bacterium]
MKYIPTIGLEIHAELKTQSKMFCSCANDPDEEKANANVCSICLGHPGTLPVLNKEAIKHVLKIGVAVDGKLADFTEWDRKNYFYPDIPKGYQISQYAYPLISGGMLAGIALERVHLEEDTAQSTHDTHEKSLVNFNRSGVPLMELVTTPTIRDAKTATDFAKELQLLLRYLGAGEANMEKGEMRVEANISVASEEDTAAKKFGTKTEVKNLNSFRAVEGAIAHEIERQIELLEKGEKVKQETRGWDEKAGETYSQRSKESSHDYRYFPDPDIPKLKISEMPEFAKSALEKELVELPWVRRERFKKEFGATDKEAEVFVDDYTGLLSRYFDDIVSNLANKDAKSIRLVINYLLTDYAGLLKKLPAVSADRIASSWIDSLDLIAPKSFGELIDMISAGDVSSSGAKKILSLLVTDENSKNISPKALADKHGLIQKSDAASIEPAIDKVIADNASVVAEYRAGKVASIQFLIGQAMKATRGAANPAVIKEILTKKLG